MTIDSKTRINLPKNSSTINYYGKPLVKYFIFSGNENVTQNCFPIEGTKGGTDNDTYLQTNINGLLSFNLFSSTTQSNSLKRKIDLTSYNSQNQGQISIVPVSTPLSVSNTTYANGATASFSITASVNKDSNGTVIPSVYTAVINDNTNYPDFIKENVDFDYIQSFYIDPNAVNNFNYVNLLSIELFLKTKPDSTNNKSASKDPGISIVIVDIEENIPIVTRYYADSFSRLSYTEISSSTDSSISSRFDFTTPLRLKAGQQYGIAVMLEDEDYKLWYATDGEWILNSTTVYTGSGETKGNLFQRTNPKDVLLTKTNVAEFKSILNTDLKFKVNIAKYTANNISLDFVPENYEFFTVNNNSTNDFYKGEYVYQDTSNATGTVSCSNGTNKIDGSGTHFISDLVVSDYVILTDGSSINTQVIRVNEIVSNTLIYTEESVRFTSSSAVLKIAPIARVCYYSPNHDTLILDDSKVRSGVVFESNGTVRGIHSNATVNIVNVNYLPVNVFFTDFIIEQPVSSSITFSGIFSEYTSSVYKVLESNRDDINISDYNYIEEYGALILSRSYEINNSSFLYSNNKSGVITANLTYNGSNVNLFDSPTIRSDHLVLSSSSWQINNDTTDEDKSTGNAHSKHITSKLAFPDGKAAEDIRIIVNAYRPKFTDIKIYARILNSVDSEAINDKSWTELELKDGINQYSVFGNKKNTIEYTYGFPNFPPSNTTLTGVCNTSIDNNHVHGVGTTWENDIINNQVIKIYSPLFPNNYMIACVSDVVSNTELILTENVTNNNIIDEGLLIDTLSTPFTAFNNTLNDNVVRYFNESGSQFDTYSTVMIKIVLLAEYSWRVPFVDDIRVIGVSV